MKNIRRNSRRPISWKSIRYFLTGAISAAFWIYSSAAPSHAVYERFTLYLVTSISVFLTAAGATAVIPIVTTALNILPWLVIVLAGSIIIWQAYVGYQEYQRENYSGISKPVANIMVTIILVFLTDALSALLIGPTGGI
jgi:hypothetical protein